MSNAKQVKIIVMNNTRIRWNDICKLMLGTNKALYKYGCINDEKHKMMVMFMIMMMMMIIKSIISRNASNDFRK